MKKIGIVGGVGWRSTVDYYTLICRQVEAQNAAGNATGSRLTSEVSIESLDLGKAIAFLGRDSDEGSWAQFDEYHRKALQRLERSGAEVALIASNTPHHRFSQIVRGIGIPVINLFEATARACARIGAANVLILGTEQTMCSVAYRQQFALQGINADCPQNTTALSVIPVLIEALQGGHVEGIAERLGTIARASIEDQFSGNAVACLACTELPLAFPDCKALSVIPYDGISYVNSTAVHIDAVFASSI